MQASVDDGDDAQDAENVALQMQVDIDSVVCPKKPPLTFFHTLALPFIHSSLSATPLSTCNLNGKTTCLSSTHSTRGLITSVKPPGFSSHRKWFRLFPLSPFAFLFFFFFFSLLILPVIHAQSPVPLRTISLNANGLTDPMKISAIQGMVRFSQPPAFVIGETKNSEPIFTTLFGGV